MPATAAAFLVIKRWGITPQQIDSADTRDDALLLAQLHAEEHYDRVWFDADQGRPGLTTFCNRVDPSLVYGYTFTTSNYTPISFEVQPNPAAKAGGK